mgnify:CR=1 FL=1
MKRKEVRWDYLTLEDVHDDLFHCSVTPETTIVSKEEISLIHSIIKSLPEKRRNVLMLIKYHGLKNKEVAEILGVSVKTVDNHLAAAIRDVLEELLQSLTMQHFKDFEVVVVEDGSSIPCKEVVDRYADRLNIKYFSKLNSGPGQTRNYGAERSEGEYRCFRRSRPCARFFHGYPKGDKLFHDFFLYDRRNPWREKEDGQILSP